MKNRGFYRVFCFSAALVLSFALYVESRVEFERGKIIEKVICAADETQQYALYLPPAYSLEKKWPILFAFDPAARGTVPLKLFKTAAEKYQYIVVCSYNARNGPWEDTIKAMKALWQDARQRFSIDTARIYTTGFSGGARAAAVFPHVTGNPVAGIIACAAGLPAKLKAEQVKPSFYYGTVGLEDFNYKEFFRLAKELKQAGVDHIIDVIDGPHNWAPEEVCGRAMDWMEVAAIKSGIRKNDRDLVDALYKNSLEQGKRLKEAGKIYHAAEFYKYTAALLDGLTDIGEIEIKITELEKSRKYKDFSRQEEIRYNKEMGFISRFAYVFSLIRNLDPGKMKLKKIVKDLQLNFLLELAGRKDDVYNRAMSRRLLPELVMKGNKEGTKFMEKGDLERAFYFLEIAARADNTDPVAFYNLACCYAGKNKKKEALKNLKLFFELAQKKGYRNFSYLETDKHLDPIRKEKKFREILRLSKQPK